MRDGAIYHWFERLGRRRYEGLDPELRGILKEKGLRAEDPFEAFKRKKAEEEERKRQEAQLAEQQAAEADAARRIAEEQASVLDDEGEEGEEKERPLIFTRMLRKSSKKGEVKDTDKPAGFDDHRFEGKRDADGDGEADRGERPEGMQSDRFD